MTSADRSRARVVRRVLALLASAEGAAVGKAVPEDAADHPALVGAAVLFACASESVPDLVDRLLWDSPVLGFTAPRDDLHIYKKLASRCFGRRRLHDLPAAEKARARRRGRKPATFEGAIVLSGSDLRGRIEDEERRKKVLSAVRGMRALIGLAAAPDADLPAELLRVRDLDLKVSGFDPWSLSIAIETATGGTLTRAPSVVLASRVRLADLTLAVSGKRGADGSLALLERLGTRRSEVRDGPLLSELPGYGEAGRWGIDLAADLRAFARGDLRGSSLDPGALLVGRPGCGKTTFAAALAREASVPFLAGSLAQWQSVGEAHLGTTLAAMRGFFDTARTMAPVVALVDELDSFGDRTRLDAHHLHYSLQVVNGFLECLDGAAGREGVVLIGATNLVDRIDPAILRSGRFDRIITIPLPSMYDLEEILRFHLGDDLEGADLRSAARLAVGGSGADCAAWVRRARSRARRSSRRIEIDDVLREIAFSVEQVDHQTERRIAVHESGHALVAYVLGYEIGDTIMRGPSGGRRAFASSQTRGATTRERLEDVLTMLLAGRVAEKLVFGTASGGAASDLEAATEIAFGLHYKWGLGDRLSVLPDGAREIDYAVVELEMQNASGRATEILTSRRDDLERLADLLFERSTLLGGEIVSILGQDRPCHGAGDPMLPYRFPAVGEVEKSDAGGRGRHKAMRADPQREDAEA